MIGLLAQVDEGIGVFQAVLNGLGWVLAKIYDFIPSYGIAIMVLTVIIRLILMPIGIKQVRSMRAMQAIQPQMKKVQQKYKGDKQKQQEEMMKLYQEHGVNPLASCLPLLLQLPVFICLYAVLRPPLPGVDNHIPEESALYQAIGEPPYAGTSFLGMNLFCSPAQSGNPETPALVNGKLVDAVTPTETTLTLKGSFTLEETGHLIALGEEQALVRTIVEPGNPDAGEPAVVSVERGAADTTAAAHAADSGARIEATTLDCGDGWPARIPYIAIMGAMIFTMYYSSRQMQKASPAAASQQQKLLKYMPLFFGIFFFQVPTGLIVYWTTSNTWQIGQQFYLLRGVAPTDPGKGSGAASSGGKKGGPGSGGRAKTIEAKGSVKSGGAKKPTTSKKPPQKGQKQPPKKAGASKAQPKPQEASKPTGFMAKMIEQAEAKREAKLNSEGTNGGSGRKKRPKR